MQSPDRVVCVTPFTVTDSIVQLTALPPLVVWVTEELAVAEELTITEAPGAPFAPATDVEDAAAPFAPGAPWMTIDWPGVPGAPVSAAAFATPTARPAAATSDATSRATCADPMSRP